MPDIRDDLELRLLVLRCQTGDEEAFAEIVGRFHRRLRYFLAKMLPPNADADDVMQEVWLEAYRGLRRLKETGAFIAWLYRLARRRVYRVWNRIDREPIVEAEITDAVAVEADVLDTADAEWIHRGLDHISPEHREVLVLRFLEEMTYDEIAAVTGAELGTVRSRLHYAKKQLHTILSREKNDER